MGNIDDDDQQNKFKKLFFQSTPLKDCYSLVSRVVESNGTKNPFAVETMLMCFTKFFTAALEHQVRTQTDGKNRQSVALKQLRTKLFQSTFFHLSSNVYAKCIYYTCPVQTEYAGTTCSVCMAHVCAAEMQSNKRREKLVWKWLTANGSMNQSYWNEQRQRSRTEKIRSRSQCVHDEC